MKHVTEKVIDITLTIATIATIILLSWLFFTAVDIQIQKASAEPCLTEDQPGWCIWNGHARYYEDNVNIPVEGR